MSLLASKPFIRAFTPTAMLAVLVIATPVSGKDVDSLVRQLRSESFSQTVLLLRDGQQYAFPTHGGMFDPTPGFEHVLANRRSLKFVEELQSIPLSERTTLLEREMALLCELFLAETRTCLTTPARSGHTSAASLENRMMGLKGSMLTLLFAAAHTSNEETLTSLLAKSNGLSTDVKKLTDNSGESHESMRRGFLRYRAPNREDIVNLIMHCRRLTGGFDELKDYAFPDFVEKDARRLSSWREVSNSRRAAPGPAPDVPDSELGPDCLIIYRFCRAAHTTDDVRASEEALERFDLAVSGFDFNAMCTRYR